MYFVHNEDNIPKEIPDTLPEPNSPMSLKPQQKEISYENNMGINNNFGKRVYGRARASLNFSSFHIFCEDFRQQLGYLYVHESETYRKNL